MTRPQTTRPELAEPVELRSGRVVTAEQAEAAYVINRSWLLWSVYDQRADAAPQWQETWAEVHALARALGTHYGIGSVAAENLLRERVDATFLLLKEAEAVPAAA
jgi:hypothetical protein